MKNIIIFLSLIFTTLIYSQTKFVFNENGLTPEYTATSIDSIAKAELYSKTLKWVEATYKHPDNVINTKIENNFIHITSIKENAIQADKRYFHLKYSVKISFEKGECKFEPIKIQSKANSKYDMGWKDVDLKNGSEFFKKGKVIKKTKSYVKIIPEVLNKLNSNLYNYLTSRQ